MAKTCFIISRIGKEGSPERGNADIKLEYLFKPVLDELGYNTIRADQEEAPGSISRGIVDRVIKSEMAIADISDQNPNVFYEIAIRNAVQKPIIIIRLPNQKPPFDIQDTRAIAVDMSDPKIWRPAMEKIKKQIQSAEKDPKKASESILSDFSFSLEKETKEDTESVLLRAVKDMQAQMRRMRKKIDENARPTLETAFTQSPATLTSTNLIGNPSFSTVPFEHVDQNINCKNCNEVFTVEGPLTIFTIYILIYMFKRHSRK